MSVNSFAQNLSGDFKYQDCGCGGVVDLQIHNGLYGQFGGDRVPDADEYSLGAITVANLNDTDGDGVVDNVDSVVTGTAAGRDEVDLMFMNITITSDVAPVCDSIRLIVSPGLEIWGSSVKRNRIGRSIAVSQLPLPVYVEAQRVSASVSDFSIIAGLVDEDGSLIKGDTVRATAAWVDLEQAHLDPLVNTPPTSLGVDPVSPTSQLAKTIDSTYISSTGRRYGYGPMRKGFATRFPNNDGAIGGKVLFQFRLYPVGLAQVVSSFGMKLDICRQKEINETVYTAIGSLQKRCESFPQRVEMGNDDTEDPNNPNGRRGDVLDEDSTPNMAGDIFSFDGPGIPSVGKENHYVIDRKNFREFVRLSFGREPAGNTEEGSRCSPYQNWGMHQDLYLGSSLRIHRPFLTDNGQLEEITQTGIFHSIPLTVAGQSNNYRANGQIIIDSLSMVDTSVVDAYELIPRPSPTGDVFWTLKFARVPFMYDSIAVSNTSSAGPWLIQSSNLRVLIKRGGNRFPNNIPLRFLVFNQVVLPNNQIFVAP